MNRPEYFGTASQQAVQRRADAMWTLLADGIPFGCHGRAVSVSGDIPNARDILEALARLQGVAACEGVPAEERDDYRDWLSSRGFGMDVFADWSSAGGSLAAARDILDRRALPDDLTVLAVDAGTPDAAMRGLDALTQDCGVLLPMGAFLRGARRPSACLYAQDRTGRIVGCAASVAQFHPDHPRAGQAWWGMLATAPERRGEGISVVLGASALLAMQERHGIASFFTGIRSGNAPSEALCTKLGLADSGRIVVIAIDPGSFDGDRITK